MRYYSGRIVQQAFDRRFRQHAESRDGIVWDIDTDNRLVRCKIQGSDDYVLCHYPRNSATLPGWCRRGNAVRISHRGGVRGNLEVVGHGRAIPTPVAGSQLPPANMQPNIVISGGAVEPYAGLTVKVTATSYRIDNVTYALVIEGIPMADPALMTMGDGTTMGADGTYLTLDAAPAAPSSRYDLIVAGKDGLAHVVKGTASESPVMPDVPADHVKLAHVLVLGGTTTLTVAHVGATFEQRRLNAIGWVLASSIGTINSYGEFEFHPTNDHPYCRVTVSLLCQYGWELDEEWTVTISMIAGTGDMSFSHTSGWTTDDLVKVFGSPGGSFYFYYRRDQTTAEEWPWLRADVSGTIVGGIKMIPLLLL